MIPSIVSWNLSQKIILMITIFFDCMPQYGKWLNQTTHHFIGKLMVCSLYPSLPTQKREMFLLYISFFNPWMNANVHTKSEMSFVSSPYNTRWRARGRETHPHGLAGWRRVTFQTRPYTVFWQCRLISRIQNINDIALFLHSLNWHSRIETSVAWITTIRRRQQSSLLVPLRASWMLENPPTTN